MTFNQEWARDIATRKCRNEAIEQQELITAFVEVCRFVSENPGSLSWRGNIKPNVKTQAGLERLAERYFMGYLCSDFPAQPGTVPDKTVSIVMEVAYGHPAQSCERIKVEHQQSMCAENCVGALLERYIDSVLRGHGWYWCCGAFVRAVDFIKKGNNGSWIVLQVKNRDNSENSSSSAIRNGTDIQKWFRTYSRTGQTNWHKLPPAMAGLGLSEDGFIAFVRRYLTEEQRRSGI